MHEELASNNLLKYDTVEAHYYVIVELKMGELLSKSCSIIIING